MAGFVIGQHAALFLVELLDRHLHAALLLKEGLVDVLLADFLAAIEEGQAHGVFGDGAGDVGGCHAVGVGHDGFHVDTVVVLHLAQIAFDDEPAAGAVRRFDGDLGVEPAGAGERRVKHVGTVGAAHPHHMPVALRLVFATESAPQPRLELVHARGLIHAIHLAEQRGERKHAEPHAHACAADHAWLAAAHATAIHADGVDLVDVGHARTVFLGEVARPFAEAQHHQDVHAPEHALKAGALRADEGHAGFAGDGLCKHGLAGAGRAIQQQAADVFAAHLLEVLAVAQQAHPLLHQLHQLRLTPVIVEGHRGVIAWADDLRLWP